MEIKKHKKTALLFGATGLIGSHCLTALLDHEGYNSVLSFGRRTLPNQHPKLKQHIVDFDTLDDYKGLIKGNDVFICLGTTRAKAGAAGFVKVDFDYTFTAAKIAALNEANQLLLVSSVGADKTSRFLYTRTKGVLEEAVCKLPFWSVHIFQPSILLGNRTEQRVGELIGSKVSLFVERLTKRGSLKKYSPIEAEVVAKAMVQAAQQIKEGVHRYASHEIQEMVGSKEVMSYE